MHCNENPFYVFPQKGIARPQSLFPHSCVCEWFIYSQDLGLHIFMQLNRQTNRGNICVNRSQTHEGGNWDWGRTIPFLGWFFWIFVTVSLQCRPAEVSIIMFTLTNMWGMHCNENPLYVFLFWKLRGLCPNFHIHVSVSDSYIPRIGPHIFVQQNRQTMIAWEYMYKSLTDTERWKLGLRPHNSYVLRSGNTAPWRPWVTILSCLRSAGNHRTFTTTSRYTSFITKTRKKFIFYIIFLCLVAMMTLTVLNSSAKITSTGCLAAIRTQHFIPAVRRAGALTTLSYSCYVVTSRSSAASV